MHKVSKPYQIRTYKGWIVRWFVSGNQKYKTFPQKQQAANWREDKIKELNPEIFNIKKKPEDRVFDKVRNEFLERYIYKELSEDSKIQATRTLKYFEFEDEEKQQKRIDSLADITQDSVNSFIKARKLKISKQTLNKELRYLRAFIRWITKKHYFNTDLEIDFVKTPSLDKQSLNDNQIIALLKACRTKTWQIRILLSLCTGLRAGDIDRLLKESLDLKLATLRYTARKTSKANSTPLPIALIPALRSYVESLNKEDGRLFPDNNIRKTWEGIRIKAELPNCKRQDFRLTFSTRIQQYSGIETAKELLQHSSKRVTEQHYSDTGLLVRIRVNRLPVKKWLKGIALI